MIQKVLQESICTNEVSSIVKNCKQSFVQQQSINDDEISMNSQTNIEDIQKQNSFSWNEKTAGYSTRTTASNSTEINPAIQTLSNQNGFIENTNTQINSESKFCKDVVFSLQKSTSSPSRSKSEDLIPLLNFSIKNKSNSNSFIQSEEQIIKKVNSKVSSQNDNPDEIDLKLRGNTKSENFILKSQNDKENLNEQLEITSLILEEIKRINIQEDDDETASPTMKLRRVKPETDNSIEERIHNWLDLHGVIQVDPSQKREQYYQSKRETLIQMKKNSKPLEEEKKQPSGLLNICKISSSPLFNRRKQNNTQPQPQPHKNKNFLEVNHDNDFLSSNTTQDINIEQSDFQSTQQQQKQIDNQNSQQIQSQQLKTNTQQKQIDITKNIHERIESPQKQIILNITSNQQIINQNNSSQDNLTKNEEVDKYQYFKNEENNLNDQDVNNNLHGQEIRLLQKVSFKSQSQTTSENNNSFFQQQPQTITKSQNQENFDFINKKSTPNLEIHKNQKRLSLKQQNSIRAQLSNN